MCNIKQTNTNTHHCSNRIDQRVQDKGQALVCSTVDDEEGNKELMLAASTEEGQDAGRQGLFLLCASAP
jgi:hypothetical protein